MNSHILHTGLYEFPVTIKKNLVFDLWWWLSLTTFMLDIKWKKRTKRLSQITCTYLPLLRSSLSFCLKVYHIDLPSNILPRTLPEAALPQEPVALVPCFWFPWFCWPNPLDLLNPIHAFLLMAISSVPYQIHCFHCWGQEHLQKWHEHKLFQNPLLKEGMMIRSTSWSCFIHSSVLRETCVTENWFTLMNPPSWRLRSSASSVGKTTNIRWYDVSCNNVIAFAAISQPLTLKYSDGYVALIMTWNFSPPSLRVVRTPTRSWIIPGVRVITSICFSENCRAEM